MSEEADPVGAATLVRHKDLPAGTALYGIRHHGPGSARSVRAALEAQRPEVVLIEGPPEADGLVELAADPDMRPPAALLAYVPGEPRTAAFWPLAVFSPEWQAISYALEAGVPVRFCDLPAAHQLAMAQGREGRWAGPGARTDPVAELAAAAGYEDPERWWEDVVEHVPGPAIFDALAEAISILRANAEEPGSRDAIREAHMRKVLRQTIREGFERIAVVCGAWHVPALQKLPPATADDRLLRGLPKVKTTMTWVPWTYGRLSYASGYGAGIRSPGWYDHLFSSPGQPIERWLARAAAVLREEGVPASSAHVIESVRLAEALASLRGRPLAGLEEVTEAARAVLCEGSDLLTALIQRRLVIAERLGTVPAATPMMPLQRDLQDQQRRLKLRPEAAPRDYDLDLRKPNNLARSHLLHRLILLDVPWGRVGGRGGGRGSQTRNIGTFRETWQLTWRPELDVALIEASMWGSTVAAAAAQRARSIASGVAAPAAGGAPGLEELTALTERCLLADLGDALPEVLAAVRDRAALDTDVTSLMAALPALVRAARYGDVRGTDPARLGEVAIEMITRICAGLPAALVSLDDTAEQAMRERIDAVHSATSLLADAASRDRWLDTLARLAGRCPPLISGRLTRLLLDAGRITADEAGLRMSRELSAAAPAPAAAGWTEGFLAGSGLLLVHDEKLLSLADAWLAGLSKDAFAAVLPALRRTFGGFAPPERRAIGERAARLDGSGRAPAAVTPAGDDLDEERAVIAVRAVAAILGDLHGGGMSTGHDERMRRWRLVLGGADDGTGVPLGGDDARIDSALGALYDSDESTGRQGALQRQAGLGASAPRVARWLGDIRTFFPVSVVQVMQKDAINRLGLTRLLLEPEMLEAVEPDVHLVGTLLSLSQVMPEKARESARAVVRTVTRDLERRLAQRTRSAVTGALNRASRTSRPRRPSDVDWDRTIRANLRNYLPEHHTIVPERLIGYARKQQAVARDVILCLDQSGSMATSVVYAGVFGAVLASIRSLRTSVVAFDTAVVDLTEQLSDPVDVLFGTQLGGGTDINRAVAYCQQLITRPASTIFILVSDLFEGGDRDQMLRRIADLTAAGTQVIALLALSDDGAPSYDHENAAALAELGVTAFACTPDSFPDLMAAAIERRDISSWAQSGGLRCRSGSWPFV